MPAGMNRERAGGNTSAAAYHWRCWRNGRRILARTRLRSILPEGSECTQEEILRIALEFIWKMYAPEGDLEEAMTLWQVTAGNFATKEQEGQYRYGERIFYLYACQGIAGILEPVNAESFLEEKGPYCAFWQEGNHHPGTSRRNRFEGFA